MLLTHSQANEFNPWMYPELAAKILFIGGLPLNTSRNQLFTYLSVFSEVIWLSIGFDRATGEFKGYAYALLKDVLKAECLLQKKTMEFMGVNIGILRWKASCDYINDKDSNLKRKLFLKGLEESVDDSDLFNYFSKFGTVEFAEVRRDHLTKQSRRIGFILFEKEESVTRCLAKKSHYLKNRRFHCKPCKSKREKDQLLEESQIKSSNSCSDKISQIVSDLTLPISEIENTILGTEVLNKCALFTQPLLPLEVMSKITQSSRESVSVLDDQPFHLQHPSLNEKDRDGESNGLTNLGYCAFRSENSHSTKDSNGSLHTPRIHKPKADLSKMFFSKPFTPLSAVPSIKSNKPINIEYFTLPGNL